MKVADSVFFPNVPYSSGLTLPLYSALGSCLAASLDTKLRNMLDVTMGGCAERPGTGISAGRQNVAETSNETLALKGD